MEPKVCSDKVPIVEEVVETDKVPCAVCEVYKV